MDCRNVKGTFVAITTDSLAVAPEDRIGELVLPLASVTSCEVSRRRKSKVLLGAGIGVLLGVSVGVSVISDCGPGVDCFGAGTIVYAPVVGAVLGVLVGAFIKTDRWEEIPLDRLRVSFVPKRDGFALGLSVSF